MRQFARLWRLVEPISDDGCDQYLSLLSKLAATAMKGGAGDLVPSADGLQCLVSPAAVRSMLPSSARRSHSIGFSEAQSVVAVGELGEDVLRVQSMVMHWSACRVWFRAGR